MRQLNRKIRVIAPSYELGASGYYRIELPLILMRTQKRADCIWRNLLQITEQDFIDKKDEITQKLAGIMDWCDLVFLERETREEIIPVIEHFRDLGKKVVMDIDDHVVRFIDLPAENVVAYWRENANKLLNVLSHVDLLITTTPRMATFYKEFMREGADTCYISNFIDTSAPRWKWAQEKRDAVQHDGLLTVGWMGGHTHLDDLARIAPAVIKASKELPIRIKFVGLIPDWAEEISADRLVKDPGYTNLDSYPGRFADFDIGLVPLERTEFNDIGKSDLKFLEYGMLGIPSVISRSPAYNSVANKKTGLLVENDTDEWYNAIKRLVDDNVLRTSIGVNVKKYVRNSRSAEGNAYRWESVFKELVLRSK